jgi:hypothetical protein
MIMGQSTTHDDRDAERTFWKSRLADLPDLRWDKVASVRRALGRGRYEVASRLDRILPELHNEVGVLCRRELGPAEGPPPGRPTSDVQVQ